MARRVIVFWMVMMLVAGSVPAAWAQDAPPEDPAAEETAPPAAEPEAEVPPAEVPEVVTEPAQALPAEEPPADPPAETTEALADPATGVDSTVPPTPTPTATLAVALPSIGSAESSEATITPTATMASEYELFSVDNVLRNCPWVDNYPYLRNDRTSLNNRCEYTSVDATLTATGSYSGSHRGSRWEVSTLPGADLTLTESIGSNYTYPTIWCINPRTNETIRQSSGFSITFSTTEPGHWLCDWYNFERQPGEYQLNVYHHVCPAVETRPSWDRDLSELLDECTVQGPGTSDATFTVWLEDSGVLEQGSGGVVSATVPVGGVMVSIETAARYAEPWSDYSKHVCMFNSSEPSGQYAAIGDGTIQINGNSDDVVTCHWFHVAPPEAPDTGSADAVDIDSTDDLPAMTYFVNLDAHLCLADESVDYMSLTVEELLGACTLDPAPLDFNASGGYNSPLAGTSWSFSADALTATTLTELNWRGYGTPIVACGQPGVPPTIEYPADRTITVTAPPYGTVSCDWFDIALAESDPEGAGRFSHNHATQMCPGEGLLNAQALTLHGLLDVCDEEIEDTGDFAFITSFGDDESHRDNATTGSFSNPPGQVNIRYQFPGHLLVVLVACESPGVYGPSVMEPFHNQVTLTGDAGEEAACRWFLAPRVDDDVNALIPFEIETFECELPLLPPAAEFTTSAWRCTPTSRAVTLSVTAAEWPATSMSMSDGHPFVMVVPAGSQLSIVETDVPASYEQHAVACWTDMLDGGQDRTDFAYISAGEPFDFTVDQATAAGCVWYDITILPPTGITTPTDDATPPSTPDATPSDIGTQLDAPSNDATPPSTPNADEPAQYTVSVLAHTCPPGMAPDLDAASYMTGCAPAGAGLGFRLTHAGGAALGDTDEMGTVNWTGIPGGAAAIQHHRPLDIQQTLVSCGDSGDLITATGGYWQLDLPAATDHVTCDLFNIPGGTASITVHTRACPPHSRAELTDVCAIDTNGITFTMQGSSTSLSATTGEAGNGAATFALAPGTYTIVESVPAGVADVFVLGCSGQSLGEIRPTPLSDTETLTITVASGDEVDCTWVNVRVPDPAMGDLVVVAKHCWTTEFVSDIDCEIDERGVTFDLLRWEGAWTPLGASTTDAYGTVAWRGIPPALYWVDPQDAAWCHIDSDRLSADGASLDVTGGQETVVTIYTCAEDARSYGKPPAKTPTKYPNTGVPTQPGNGSTLPGMAATGAGLVLSRRRFLAMTGASLLAFRASDGDLAAQDADATPTTLCLGDAPDPDSGLPCARGAVPAHVRIPAIDVDAPIEILEVVGGEMQQPTDEVHVAWYKESARLGERGNIHLAGHLNWWGVPEAVFFALDTLAEGDEVVILDEDGTEFTYTVEWSRQESNLEPPSDDALGMTPYQALTLITCSGAWNTDMDEYDRRTVVRARRSPSD